jgi:hypothetical protein
MPTPLGPFGRCRGLVLADSDVEVGVVDIDKPAVLMDIPVHMMSPVRTIGTVVPAVVHELKASVPVAAVGVA